MPCILDKDQWLHTIVDKWVMLAMDMIKPHKTNQKNKEDPKTKRKTKNKKQKKINAKHHFIYLLFENLFVVERGEMVWSCSKKKIKKSFKKKWRKLL